MLKTEKYSVTYSGLDYMSEDFEREFDKFKQECNASGGEVVPHFNRNDDIELVCVRKLD